MTLLLGLLTFLVILAALILVHELGHFSTAKLMGVRVDEFGVGFPPRVKGWRRGETLYSLNAIPLGGFVKMQGENGDATAPGSFGSKAPWKRLVILASGPAMNIALAMVIFFFTFLAGSPTRTTVVTMVEPGSPAARAGLMSGDRVLSLDTKDVTDAQQLHDATQAHLGVPVRLVVQRGGTSFETSLVPRRHPPRQQGAMGIQLGDTTVVSYTPSQALHMSVSQVGLMVSSLPTALTSATQQGGQGIQGPIGIAHDTTTVVHDTPQIGIGAIFQWAALLSVTLGIMNLLPIPALDGGRIAFVLLSWIRRRNLDPEVEGVIHMVGMAVLLLVILLVSYRDVIGWITGSGPS